MRIDAISLGKNPPHEVNVIIEVPVGVFPEPFDVIRPPATRGKKG